LDTTNETIWFYLAYICVWTRAIPSDTKVTEIITETTVYYGGCVMCGQL